MRYIGLVAAVLVAGCSQPGSGASSASPTQTSAASLCRLPVWWGVGQDIRAGFVSVPGGAFTDAGILPPVIPNTSGGTYLSSSKRWLRASRALVSPDGTQVVYWKTDPQRAEVHVFNVASRDDRMVYSGTDAFFPIAFTSDRIYLQGVINLKQGSVKNLYRLAPAGGIPQLVTGSDRRMHPSGWSLVADGAAWGIDTQDSGGNSGYYFFVLRLDLATAQVTTWVDRQLDKMFYPQGVDGKHRLYAAPARGPMWRVDSPGHWVELPLQFPNGTVGPTFAVDDWVGAWFSGQGGVWLYADGQDPKKFAVPTSETVWPAGPCT